MSKEKWNGIWISWNSNQTKEKNINSNQPWNKENRYQSNQVKGKKMKNPSKISRDPRFWLKIKKGVVGAQHTLINTHLPDNTIDQEDLN